MLKSITVSIDDLFLDPNNPRFVTDLNVGDAVSDDQIATLQNKLLQKFDNSLGTSDEDNFFSIEDLKVSMRGIGYVGIDRIVVRKILNNKYVVLEGNRRTSTIKILLKKHQGAPPTDKENRLQQHILDTFQELDVMELDCDGLPKEEIAKRISIILGLRHFGSLLEWEPLPRAYNMFHNYMSIEPKLDSFIRENSRVSDVASRLSIKPTEVRKVLQTYICYLQLSENYSGVEDKYYSLIQSAITNKNIVGNGYIKQDVDTFELDENSLDKLYQICQFEDRARRPAGQTIVPDPKKFKLLGHLIKKSKVAENENVRDYASGLIQEIEKAEIDPETNVLVLSLDAAVDALNDFESSTEWVNTIDSLLKKQETDLNIDEFVGVGNDAIAKQALENSLSILRLIFKV